MQSMHGMHMKASLRHRGLTHVRGGLAQDLLGTKVKAKGPPIKQKRGSSLSLSLLAVLDHILSLPSLYKVVNLAKK